MSPVAGARAKKRARYGAVLLFVPRVSRPPPDRSLSEGIGLSFPDGFAFTKFLVPSTPTLEHSAGTLKCPKRRNKLDIVWQFVLLMIADEET